jgi:phosphoribosylanthranilate isomerase
LKATPVNAIAGGAQAAWRGADRCAGRGKGRAPVVLALRGGAGSVRAKAMSLVLPLPVLAKVCGLSSFAAVEAAALGGASHAGFIHFPKSPRHMDFAQAAPLMQAAAALGMTPVSVLVNPDDDTLAALLAAAQPGMIQLHGAEDAARIRSVQALGLPVIKAVGVGSGDDVARARQLADVADLVLLDAKPPADARYPGGLGVRFDWRLLDGFASARPWLLSGGLDAANVGEALARTGAPGVDVSSGVESAPGVKDTARITAFLQAVRAATTAPAHPA